MSILGFGCGAMLGRVGRAQALRALEVAYDNGITHFDVARSYGFGEAEMLLGSFLRGKRDAVSVTTKFGIVPPRNASKLGLAKSAARAVLSHLPGGRSLARAAARKMLAHRDYSPAYARACLDTSLRDLCVERVDHYMIHDPAEADLSDELLGFLEDARRAGKIDRWGIATDHPPVLSSPAAAHAQALLYEGNLNVLDALCKAPDPAGRPVFLARPFGGGGGALQGAVKRPPIYHVLRTLGLTPVDDNTLAVFFALSHAGRTGTVVTSMFTEAHLRQNLALVSQFEALGERGQQIAPAILHAVCPQDCSLRG
ncbi:aryl-alcohol dehydrogenase-like predicted oxidoreductase [Cupriavidus metallidurans]|jgi:aryl-alcohol dehydrogenase-like predicted oxidoreductase|uniref:aldo/keto reductase n=1 Tax=Burkholderiaceae TaxID=119060 RepID=UPI0004635C84|nr:MULTISPECIES: aldo/keto reductase [Burkholderiaceae]KWW32437.1 D-threo-aldose 1-dehydrogenase [Cupriavidus metallidurans]MCA3183407.1 aldo/keto reductase [Cupriavidus sp.]MCA3193976.1 aldo/keto reductase [Cupriavidus sp.]MCA3198405.1 aldo/keto reductase [Cupriavidus sp.]MDE4922843.1 aldo/keto reductase [Cupriavidus metallidurans]